MITHLTQVKNQIDYHLEINKDENTGFSLIKNINNINYNEGVMEELSDTDENIEEYKAEKPNVLKKTTRKKTTKNNDVNYITV